jgi:hypothetical protein
MPATKTKAPKAKKAATTRKRPAAAKRPATRTRPAAAKKHPPTAIERTTELSDEVLKSLEEGAKSALEAVRRFAETVDKSLPAAGKGPSRREEITDSALEMAERLVHTQYEFLRKVVESAGKSVEARNGKK